jgi:vitamin B12 transporter
MKSPKGFKGKYFSLAAITVVTATVTLQAQTVGAQSIEQASQEYAKEAHEEEVLLKVDEAPVALISKKIASEKSTILSANKTPISPTNLTDNVTIITAQELALHGATTIKDALQITPGLSINQSGGKGQQSSLFLQGMSNQYTLVLIDGVRLNDPSNLSGANLSHLLLDNIERIEIIKGAQSGIWGADAAAGVINIITKESKPGLHGFASFEAGSYGHRLGKAGVSYKTPLSDIALHVSRLQADGPSAQAPKGENIKQYEDDSYRNTSLHVRLGHWIDSNNRLEAGFRNMESKIDYDGWNAPNSSDFAKHKEYSVFANYQHFSGPHSITLSGSKSQFKRNHYEFMTYKYRGDSQEIELKDRYKYSDSGLLLFGVEVGEDEARYESFKDSIQNQAAFINHNYSFGSWVFTQALRYDAFDAFSNQATGKLGLTYALNPHLKLYINGGTAYKAPSILNMLNPWGASNFNLKPESIQSYNVGLRFHALHVNLFYNEIDDMIDWRTINFKTYEGQYQNISGKSTFKGVEIAYEHPIGENYLVGANYTYTDAKDKDDNRLLNRPRYNATGHLTYAPTKNLSITTLGEYIGPRKDYSGVDTGRYFLAHINTQYIINKTWSLSGKIENIFDKNYQEVDGYATLGRSFYLGVKASF